MKIEVEVDEQEVIDNLDADEIFEKSGIGETDCKQRFGDGLLDEWKIEELINYHGEEDLLYVIGEAAAINYFEIKVAE